MNNLKYYRTKANMKKQELADQLGIHQDYVSMIERGARRPGFNLAKRMADLFGITVDELFFCPIQEQNVQSEEFIWTKKHPTDGNQNKGA